jgi:sacsin
VLRSEEAAENLTKIESESKLKALDFLLKEIIPKCDADFEELNGCRVLPLSDGTMGMLTMEESFQQTVTYYIASKSEVELFDFASELLTPEDQGNDFKLQVLQCQKKFNIKLFDLPDIGALLGKKIFQQFNSSTEFEAWLRQFWRFWHEREINHKESVHNIFTSASGVNNYPILEASRDGVKTYLSPSDLERLPSALEPADELHKKLCDKISGLYRLNTNFVLLNLKEAETSLDSASSFSRLIKSLSILAPKHSGGLERYIREIFGEVELQV